MSFSTKMLLASNTVANFRLIMQVFISEKLYEEEEVDLPIPIIYYSRSPTHPHKTPKNPAYGRH